MTSCKKLSNTWFVVPRDNNKLSDYKQLVMSTAESRTRICVDITAMTTREKVIERQGRSSKTHLEKQGNRKRTEKKRFCQKKKKNGMQARNRGQG